MWTIWYDNDKVSGSTYGEWVAASANNVVAVHVLFARENNVNIGEIHVGVDWYWMMPDGSIFNSRSSSDVPGEWLDSGAPEDAVLKSGVWVSDERMREVENELVMLVVS